jgi:HlyD family secretion protein
MEEKKQASRVFLWLSAIVLLIAVFFGVRMLTRERLPVREARVARESLVNQISTNGLVQPITNYEVHSPLATTVKAVYVHQGDHVAAGKVLLELDDLQARARVAAAESGVKAAQAAYEAATHNGSLMERQGTEADLAKARIDRDQAQNSLDALKKLQAAGAASPSEVMAAQERLDTANASLHAAETTSHGRYAPADIARAQAALDEAEAGLAAAREVEAQTRPVAPFAGTVYTMSAGRSEFAEDGKLLIQIADLHKMHVVAYFDEPDIGQLAVGEAATIKWNAKPDRVWHGHVTRVPTTVLEYKSRTVGETIIDVDDGDGDLLPDTNVNVSVTTASQNNILTVARDALHVENGRPYVFKVVGDHLVRTPVTVGTSNLVLTPILSGLAEGDIVATGTTNGLPLQEGEPIRNMQ